MLRLKTPNPAFRAGTRIETPNHPLKNRFTLIRTLIWYLDTLGDNDPIETIRLANGRPAVELSFRFDSGYATQSGEPWQLCGHLDRLGTFAGSPYIVDIKTSGSTLTPRFFEGFNPSNQFSLYDLAGQLVYNIPTKGIIVDGIQIAATFSRFQRAPVPRDKSLREEWHSMLGDWLESLESTALRHGPGDPSGSWPMNDKNCDQYGGCVFRPVCGRPKPARLAFLRNTFVQRVWDPLVTRGDV